MKDLALYVVVVVACSICFLVLHVPAVRWFGKVKLITALGATIVVSALIGGGLSWRLLGPDFSAPAAGLVACVAGALTFCGFAGVYSLIGPISVDRSVSSHIVGLIWIAPGHILSEEELFELYTHDDLLMKRFHDCIETGIIVQQNGKLVTTRRGAAIARVYSILGRLLGMRLWHFDRLMGRTPHGRE